MVRGAYLPAGVLRTGVLSTGVLSTATGSRLADGGLVRTPTLAVALNVTPTLTLTLTLQMVVLPAPERPVIHSVAPGEIQGRYSRDTGKIQWRYRGGRSSTASLLGRWG